MASANVSSAASTAASTTAAAGDTSDYCRTTEWYILLGVSLGTYLLAVIVILLMRVVCGSGPEDGADGAGGDGEKRRSKKMGLMTKLHLQCLALMKGSNTLGKVLLAFYTICVIVSFVLYVLMTYQFTDAQPAESRTLLICFKAATHPIVHVEFAVNLYYCVIFVLRLMASDSLLSFWLTMDTLADHLTIIPAVLMYAMDKHLIAFQFARLVGLRFLVNTLIYCNIVRSEKYIRLIGLLIQIIAIWAVSAGLFQLIEVVGDFWRYSEGATSASFYQYHDCIYFMLITMSTVGYGDISPKTVIGKFFIILFICVALGLFTSIIPEVSDILSENKKYRRNRVRMRGGKKHVVVIAKFNTSLLRTFFADFFHSERAAEERQMVALLGRDEPDLELKAQIKKRELYTMYLQGSVMNVKDLQRACVSEASAVIVLADMQAADLEDEDMKNIMRVIAIKDYCPTVQVLVQLQLYRTKTYLRNIPDWSADHGDEAVCVNEIRYGILAQSCLVPGLSTLLCNLLMLRSSLSEDVAPFSWEAAYLHGVEYEFYRVPFSRHFDGRTFTEAAEICAAEMGITLLAVEQRFGDGARRTVINPGSKLRIHQETMLAFVIASDEKEAKCVKRFQPNSAGRGAGRRFLTLGCCRPCRRCCPGGGGGGGGGGGEEPQLQAVTSVSLSSVATCDTIVADAGKLDSADISLREVADSSGQQQRQQQQQQRQKQKHDQGTGEHLHSGDLLLDSSGYFHWAPNRSIDDIALQQPCEFRGHVIVCILEKSAKVCLNLTSFLMPLRASSLPPEKIKDVVFIGKVELLQSEWTVIQNFPKIHVLNGSPLNRANLKAASIENCHSCLIMSPKTAEFEPDAQVDRETVLCTLNIKTMKNSVTGERLGDSIHIITELNTEEAIAYLDQDDEAEVDEAFMTQAFATGRTFFLSLLDSLVTTIYFNPAALSFLRTIVTTVDSDNFEIDLNEQGFHFLASNHSHTIRKADAASQGRSQIEMMPVSRGPLAQIFGSKSPLHWKEFTLQALKQLEIVCIGLSRLQVEDEGSKNHRFVMTMPQDGVVVKATDMVYCLTPPNFEL